MKRTAEENKIRNERLRAWRAANPEKVKGYLSKYYGKNPEKFREASTKWRRENPERYAEHVARRRAKMAAMSDEEKALESAKKRAAGLKRRYNITLDDYETMLAAQGGKCAICQTDRMGAYGILDVDHCHETGKVRGLLCISCNHALGVLGDNEAGMLKALEYLRK